VESRESSLSSPNVSSTIGQVDGTTCLHVATSPAVVQRLLQYPGWGLHLHKKAVRCNRRKGRTFSDDLVNDVVSRCLLPRSIAFVTSLSMDFCLVATERWHYPFVPGLCMWRCGCRGTASIPRSFRGYCCGEALLFPQRTRHPCNNSHAILEQL
jgi:hypothetical protein